MAIFLVQIYKKVSKVGVVKNYLIFYFNGCLWLFVVILIFNIYIPVKPSVCVVDLHLLSVVYIYFYGYFLLFLFYGCK